MRPPEGEEDPDVRGDPAPAPGRDDPSEVGSEDAIIGATLEGLRRAAEEVEQIAAIAETLQRSLLDERLPDIVGLKLAARYMAGSVDAQVGGDWYDVIPLRGGQAGIAIGDVVGHGIDAATRMAHLRSALRAYALERLRPSLVLERMNEFARALAPGAMATLLFGVVDPDERRITIASAGHPPPLVISQAGEATYPEGKAGSPLGVRRLPAYEETILALEPESMVFLYTDGLVERPEASLDAGLDWLRGFAGDYAGRPSELCAALLEACFRSARPRDDVALLGVSLEPLPIEGIELSLSAEPESLASMRRALGRWLRALGASDAESYELLVACGEACANAVAHAYPPGEASYLVRTRRLDDGVEIEVRDYGSWRAPRAGSRGRGLELIEQLVDEVEIDRGSAGTVVTMRRRLDGGGRA